MSLTSPESGRQWDCVCAGIVVADHICPPLPRLPSPGELQICDRLDLAIGGCAANVAVDLTKQERKVLLSARIGNDLFGDYLKKELEAAAVCVEGLLVTPGHQTSGTLIINVKGEDRRFIHTVGANASYTGDEITTEHLLQTRILYVGGYFAMRAFTPAQLARLFERARGEGVRTVLDVVLPEYRNYSEDLRTILPWTDFFLPNEDEARGLVNEKEPVDQARVLQKMGAGTVVITQGQQGATLVSGDRLIQSRGFLSTYVDGTGSGDAFAAGFIEGLLRGGRLEDCLLIGSALGASCVRSSGATTGVFRRPELELFLQKHELEINSL